MYVNHLGLERLINPCNFSAWDESLSTESPTHPSGGRLKSVVFFVYAIRNDLTRGALKLEYNRLTDAEAAFLGFSNACASAGRDGCKLLTLLRKNATGKEVKRFIEDSHDVGNQPGSCSSFTYLE